MKRNAEKTPRQVVLRGTYAAAGLIVGPPLSAPQRRARILRIWRPGATVYRLPADGAYFIVWSHARRGLAAAGASGEGTARRHRARPHMTAETAAGQIVIEAAGRFVTAEMTERQLDRLGRPGGLVRVHHGRVDWVDLGAAAVVDPSAWIDVGPVAVVDVEPLGAPPSPPIEVPEPAPVDLRKEAGLPPADHATLRAVQDALRDRRSRTLAPLGAETTGWRRGIIEGVRRLARWLSRRTPAGARTAARGTADADGETWSWWNRTRERIADWLAHSVVRWLTGAWHQRYLDRVLGMFAAGDLREALRHAIPLGGDGEPARTALRPPSPRDRLEFGRQRGPAAGIMGSDEAWQTLERRYRQAVDTLIADRRLKEAAFVLAELLREPDKAVAMLEREGAPRVAAELADARGLAPRIRVRLWAKAGEWDRAVRLARRHEAFGEAIAGLGRNDREVADKLRALWAAHRAEVGDYLGAIDLVWPRQKPSQAWLDAATALGGTAAARALPKQLALTPDAFGAVRARVLELAAAEGPEAERARRALADGFIRESGAAGVATLARPLVRAMVADRPRTVDERKRIAQLVKVTGDEVLKADMPAWSVAASDAPPRMRVDAADRGLLAVHDAAKLATGRILVALGEAGVLLATADGRPLAHLKVPATRLVPSDTGHRALALVMRGEVAQIHRLDLVRWRATTWCELALSVWAASFDGWRWFAAVAPTHQALMLDVTAKRAQTEWSTGVHRPVALVRDGAKLSTLSRDDDELVAAVFDANQLRMTSRRPLGDLPRDGRPALADLSARGELLVVHPNDLVDVDPGAITTEWAAHRRPTAQLRPLRLPPRAEPAVAKWSGGDFVLALRHAGWTEIRGFAWRSDEPWVRLRLEGTEAAGLRSDGDRLTVWDDLGRVLVIDRERRAVESDFRVRL